MRKRYSRSYTVLSFLTMFSYREQPFSSPFFHSIGQYHCTVITYFECGFHLWVWADAMQIMLFIRISVVILVLLTYLPAEWLTGRIVK